MEEKEIWKDCLGYEGLYLVSNLGNVFSLRTNKILKPADNGHGYMTVRLYSAYGHKYKNKYTHRLVAEAFKKKPSPECITVNHIDEHKDNNKASNLEWVTIKQNDNYGTRNYRISKQVMCLETGVTYKSMREAGEMTGTSAQNISLACSGKRNMANSLHWRYVN